jgi:hypothetical protein
MLNTARRGLIGDHERLTALRRLGQLNQNDRDLLLQAENNFLASLERVWLVQAMFDPSQD